MEIRRPAIRASVFELRHAFQKGPLVAVLCLLSALPAWCQSLPEFFGIYANVDGKLASMIGGKGNFTPSHSGLQVLDYYTGDSGTQTTFELQGNGISFLVFDSAVADVSATVELYKLPYARNMITRPEAVSGLLGQISGSPQGNSASSLQEYIVAKTDELKIELLQKPVAGQPQMVQLVPASGLESGIYGLFAVRNQGGQTTIVDQIFEWKGASGAVATQFCIDMLHTGGFGGLIEDHDARLEHPYSLAKEKYVPCGAGIASGTPSSGSSTKGTGALRVEPAEPPQPTCSQVTDAGYVINLQNHLYRVKSSGPAVGTDRKLFFFDMSGTNQVTDSALLAQLVAAVWTHDNVITSADARNGSTRVSAILVL
jgi:hypothetical protein